MNFFQAGKYVEYRLFSRHRKGHGIHSPFIFDIVSGLFRNKMPEDVVCCIETIRRKLEKDKRVISVNDLGAGSGLYKKERRVSDIARRSAVTRKYGILLHNIAGRFGGNAVIELGTSLGISSMYLGSSSRNVYTVEGCSECASIASGNYADAGLSNITVINSPFQDAIADFESKGIMAGVVFIDGDHREEPLLRYFTGLASISDENTVFVIDDIYYSKELASAWKKISHMDNVTATINIFRMGIVFFKKGITRNNYIVRY